MYHPSKTAPRLAVVLAALLTPQSALSFAGKIGLSVRTTYFEGERNARHRHTAGLIVLPARSPGATHQQREELRKAVCILVTAAVVTLYTLATQCSKGRGEPATDPPCNEYTPRVRASGQAVKLNKKGVRNSKLPTP